MEKLIKLELSEKFRQDPLIYHLGHDFNVVFNIRKGFFTEEKAWVELELEGSAKNIEKLYKYLEEQQVIVTEL